MELRDLWYKFKTTCDIIVAISTKLTSILYVRNETVCLISKITVVGPYVDQRSFMQMIPYLCNVSDYSWLGCPYYKYRRLYTLRKAMENQFGDIRSSELNWRPTIRVTLSYHYQLGRSLNEITHAEHERERYIVFFSKWSYSVDKIPDCMTSI